MNKVTRLDVAHATIDKTIQVRAAPIASKKTLMHERINHSIVII